MKSAPRAVGRGLRSPAATLALLLIVSAVLLLYGLAGTPFRGLYDDVDRALIARDMVDRGDWVVPHYHERPLHTKPPLFYWTAGLLYRVSGRRDELPGALASVLASLAVIAATWATARRLLGPRAGAMAALVLLTSYLFLAMARQPLIDTVMMAGFALSYWALVGAMDEPGRARWWILAFAGLGLSSLTKGPIILPILALISVPLWDRPPRALPSRRAMLGGLALALAIVLPWAVLLLLRAPEARQVLSHEFFGRAGAGFEPHAWTRRPWWFYLADLHHFGPWLPLLPAAVVAAWRGRGERRFRLLLWWAVGGLAFFSLASANKRSYYLLPLYPAFAMLCAAAVEDPRAPRRLLAWGMGVSAALLGLAGVAAAALPLRFEFGPAVAFYAAGTVAVGGAALAARELRRGRRASPLAALLVAAAALELVWFGHALPPLNAYRAGDAFCREAAARLEAGPPGPVAIFHVPRSLTAFYLERPARWPESEPVQAAVARGEPAWLVADPDRLVRFEGPGRPEAVLERTLRSPTGQQRRLGLYRLIGPAGPPMPGSPPP